MPPKSVPTELVHDSPLGVDDIGDRPKVEASYSALGEDEHFPGWYEQHQQAAFVNDKIMKSADGAVWHSKFEKENKYTHLLEGVKEDRRAYKDPNSFIDRSKMIGKK